MATAALAWTWALDIRASLGSSKWGLVNDHPLDHVSFDSRKDGEKNGKKHIKMIPRHLPWCFLVAYLYRTTWPRRSRFVWLESRGVHVAWQRSSALAMPSDSHMGWKIFNLVPWYIMIHHDTIIFHASAYIFRGHFQPLWSPRYIGEAWLGIASPLASPMDSWSWTALH